MSTYLMLGVDKMFNVDYFLTVNCIITRSIQKLRQLCGEWPWPFSESIFGGFRILSNEMRQLWKQISFTNPCHIER